MDLETRILVTLYKQIASGASASWVRFLARDEAQRVGGGAADAEAALRRLHTLGYLAQAFGFERGRLTRRGLWIAERLLRRGGMGWLAAQAR